MRLKTGDGYIRRCECYDRRTTGGSTKDPVRLLVREIQSKPEELEEPMSFDVSVTPIMLTRVKNKTKQALLVCLAVVSKWLNERYGAGLEAN